MLNYRKCCMSKRKEKGLCTDKIYRTNQLRMQQGASMAFQSDSEQISKIVPVDAAIYVENSTITVSNLWQMDPET